jgi:hypothetical protein
MDLNNLEDHYIMSDLEDEKQESVVASQVIVKPKTLSKVVVSKPILLPNIVQVLQKQVAPVIIVPPQTPAKPAKVE